MRTKPILILCLFFLTALAACGQKHADPAPEESRSAETVPVPITQETEVIPETALCCQLNAFDAALTEYLGANGYYYEDFVVSPAAFRASLCLAAMGAVGNTRTELVGAAGFSGMDEMELWYMSCLSAAAGYSGDAPLYLADAVWNNSDLLGDFTERFAADARERYRAGAYVCENDALTGAIGSWMDETTNGIMTGCHKDVDGAASVLTSLMYLETAWKNDFRRSGNGSMEQTGEFLYADTGGTQIVVIPMQGELSFVCFRGNRTGMFDGLSELAAETVRVVLPEFELRSGFDASVLLNFAIARNVREALNGTTANFRPMCADSDWCLQEILQAAQISVRAGTAPEDDAANAGEAAEAEFIADGAFSFLVCYGLGTEQQQVFLYGQRAEA